MIHDAHDYPAGYTWTPGKSGIGFQTQVAFRGWASHLANLTDPCE
jgi:hypothetical protein